jgi:hypothetical protein
VPSSTPTTKKQVTVTINGTKETITITEPKESTIVVTITTKTSGGRTITTSEHVPDTIPTVLKTVTVTSGGGNTYKTKISEPAVSSRTLTFIRDRDHKTVTFSEREGISIPTKHVTVVTTDLSGKRSTITINEPARRKKTIVETVVSGTSVYTTKVSIPVSEATLRTDKKVRTVDGGETTTVVSVPAK